MLPAYWPVCKFGLILAIHSVLTSIYCLQLAYISLHSYCLLLFLFSASFVVPLCSIILL